MGVFTSWRGQEITAAAIEAGRKQCHLEAELILTDTIPITPFRYGVLRASGHVDDTDNGAIISFSTPYAVKQHEDTSLVHSEPGTQAKFLEVKMIEHQDEALKNISGAMKKAMK